ncbi:MAG: flagellar motor switch protein FliN, partial [Planctomycetota bacterium]
DPAENSAEVPAADGASQEPTAETQEQPESPVPHAAERAIDEAQRAAAALRADAGDPGPPRDLNLPDLGGPTDGASETGAGLALLRDVNLQVKVELGRTRMFVEDVLRLNEDSVIELDKLAGDPVDIYVNDRHVARGEVLVVNDNFCVRVSEIIQPVATED